MVIDCTVHKIDKNIVRITIDYLDSLCALPLPLSYSSYYGEAKRLGGLLGLVGRRGNRGYRGFPGFNVFPMNCSDCGIVLSTLAEYSNHSVECVMVSTYCTYSECNFSARKFLVREHEQTECIYRTVGCEFCHRLHRWFDWYWHMRYCPNVFHCRFEDKFYVLTWKSLHEQVCLDCAIWIRNAEESKLNRIARETIEVEAITKEVGSTNRGCETM